MDNWIDLTIPLQEDLYAKVCSLSYTGDVRMLFAEDKNKVFLVTSRVGCGMEMLMSLKFRYI